MSKFAQRGLRTNVTAPVTTTGLWMPTYEGGRGFERDPRSELFILAVSNLVGEDTFYETGSQRDQRFTDLVHQVTKEDPGWVARFVRYLRHDLYLRSCPLVMAAEYVAAGGPHGRAVVASALDRADEPAEMLAYWFAFHGRSIPKPIKRGVADAAQRLYTERSALRYDGTAALWRMGDVIDLVHPAPAAPWQGELFTYLLDHRHNRPNPRIGESLGMIAADRYLLGVPEGDRRSMLRSGVAWQGAGWSWERLSGWLPGGMDREAWEAVIPHMGYMALLRNLRNFDNAGVSDEVAAAVATKLAAPDEVARSRQLPVRFLSAWSAVASMRWGSALDKALEASLAGVPALTGRSLVLVDVSGSMVNDAMIATYHGRQAAQSVVKPWMTAAIFGAALAKRSPGVELYAYGQGSERIPVSANPYTSVLRPLEVIGNSRPFKTGTETIQTVASLYDGHDRVIVLTDEQAFDAGGYHHAAVDAIPLIYTWNLAGYRPGHQPSGARGRYTFGGLTDAAFRLLAILEAHRSGQWPF